MAQLFPRAVVARALVFVPMVAVAACSDGVGPSASSMVSVAFRVAPATSGPSASRMLSDSTPTVPASEITLTKVQLVLSHIELSRIDSGCVRADTTDDERDEGERRGDCHEIKLAPMLVDLPLTADAKVELSAPVPPGKYRNLHARITALTSESRQKGAADFIAANPDFAGTSVRIEGTYAGKPFTFVSNLRAEIYIPFRPPLDLTESTTPNVTVAVDPSRWFKTQNGTTIDPTTVGLDQPNNAYIAANIRRSFRVFRDDDHDGRGDHEHQGQN
jgi:hypothetical protein